MFIFLLKLVSLIFIDPYYLSDTSYNVDIWKKYR